MLSTEAFKEAMSGGRGNPLIEQFGVEDSGIVVMTKNQRTMLVLSPCMARRPWKTMCDCDDNSKVLYQRSGRGEHGRCGGA